MSLLLSPGDIEARRPVAAGPLQPLAASLAADLSKVIARPLYIPEQKALLSREGGRCSRDGTMLDFDPFSPHEHRCPKCGEVYRGELHDGFWIYWYQLWLAERAVHAALLARLGILAEGAAFAGRILDGYGDLYSRYPNVDNALGPTRPFFSTYLESIWLLQLCIAAGLIEAPSADRFRDAVVEPSVRLIASFDEGLSNRQVWNNAAMIAAYRSLERDEQAASVVWAASGVVTHLTEALLPDGTWYEGENYHFFAHRGLWYCMQLASGIDAEVPGDLVARYDAGFRAPFLTALPDLTFPSRRDSQYAVSLRQWRFAEMCELGLARADDRVLHGMLSRLYSDDIPRIDPSRWKSAAEAERNHPASRLDRSDLGWKSLLFARPELDLAAAPALPSVLLDAQGIGVIRRDAGRVYVALDYGVSGGGHGHPDRLNLLVSNGDTRVLDDMGTGSYVDASLHWYRSTLAHNAPMFDGLSQDRVDGDLLAFDDRGAAGWISARAEIGFAMTASRTVVVMPDYLIDEVTWGGPGGERIFDLPLHLDLQPVNPVDIVDRTPLSGSQGLEDGFRFISDPKCIAQLQSGQALHLRAAEGDFWLASDVDAAIWNAVTPGPPGRPDQRMTIVRANTPQGIIRWMWRWTGGARPLALIPDPVIQSAAERHDHARVEHGWQVAIHVGGARSTIDLQGQVDVQAIEAQRPMRFSPPFVLIHAEGVRESAPIERMLGEAHYRRSEESWIEAGSPAARVELARRRDLIAAKITVIGERSFVAAEATNRLDNEPADINGAGVQLYLGVEERRAGYVIVPRVGGDEIAVRPIEGWGDAIPISGSWRPTTDGYELTLQFRGGPHGFAFDLIVNEKPAGRQRRRGQLVFSGAKGEFIYLRGDRHDPHQLIFFNLTDD